MRLTLALGEIMREWLKVLVWAAPIVVVLGCDPSPQRPVADRSDNESSDSANELPVNRSEVDESSRLPLWKPDESDLTELDGPYDFGDYEFRPPRAFKLLRSNHREMGMRMDIWMGKIREDETYAQLLVMISEPSIQNTKFSLKKTLRATVDQVRMRRSDWTEEEFEEGQVNGISFVRTSWSGVATDAAREGLAGRKMHGVVYLAIHNERVISIMCQDVAPDHATSLEFGHLAAKTFAARPQSEMEH
ncbi:MAG: hypothetical protein R3C18_09365 [Planctomycetaceae bacterium]